MEHLKGKSLPKLRFPEFTEPWQEKRGRELFANRRLRGKEGLPIYSVTLTKGLVPRDSLDRQFGGDADIESHLRAKPNDLVYNMMRMWQGAVGRADVECMVSPAYVVLSPEKDVNSKYFDYYLQRARSLYDLWAYSYGLTDDRLRLYYRDFGQIKFRVPKHAEQERISAVLTTVDEKIAALRRQRELLQTYKRGMMQKIFSREVRFKADDGTGFPERTEKRLGKIAENIGGGTPETSINNYWDGGIQWFTPSEIKDKYLKTSKRTISELGIKKSSAKLLPVGSLLLSTRATVGDVGIATLPCTTNQGFQSFVVTKDNSNEFWYYWILMSKKEILKRAAGSTFLEINKSSIESIKALVPHPKEQQKIANFLSAIDAKIDAVTGQIEKMEQFKKGLLQQMLC